MKFTRFQNTVFATVFSFMFVVGLHAISSATATSGNHQYRAPRSGSSDLSVPSECVGRADSAELDLIRRCVCRVDSNIVSLLSCCEELQQKVSGCNVTPISNADAVGDTITLDTPGHYCATENLTKKIIIASGDVSLDLNLYRSYANSES